MQFISFMRVVVRCTILGHSIEMSARLPYIYVTMYKMCVIEKNECNLFNQSTYSFHNFYSCFPLWKFISIYEFYEFRVCPPGSRVTHSLVDVLCM